MLCTLCGKKQGEVFFKQIIDNQITQHVLCTACAKIKGLGSDQPNTLFAFLSQLSGLALSAPSSTIPTHLKCDSCGMRFSQFMASGKLGCPECYEAFKVPLSDLLKRIHGTSQHKAKNLPQNPVQELSRLKRELQTAVLKEHFEDAAKLRDQIHDMEKRSLPPV